MAPPSPGTGNSASSSTARARSSRRWAAWTKEGFKVGVWTIHDRTDDMAVLADSVTEWAFGPVFHGHENLGLDAYEVAELFIKLIERRGFDDPRCMTEDELQRSHSILCRWLNLHGAHWTFDELLDAVKGG